ncbi:MAG: NfeD family protein [Alistipes sp.]|nr:NfeD family protein [Alistipes sp.]
MGYIILLVVLGVLFLLLELVLLPGVSFGAILSLVCYGSAVYMAFANYDTTVGLIVLAVVVLVSILTTILSLRAKTWRRLSLHQEIDSTSMEQPGNELAVGQRGVAVSRLSPTGKVDIGGKTFEARSVDVYIAQREAVEVVGFDNFTVVVRKVE